MEEDRRTGGGGRSGNVSGGNATIGSIAVEQVTEGSGGGKSLARTMHYDVLAAFPHREGSTFLAFYLHERSGARRIARSWLPCDFGRVAFAAWVVLSGLAASPFEMGDALKLLWNTSVPTANRLLHRQRPMHIGANKTTGSESWRTVIACRYLCK